MERLTVALTDAPVLGSLLKIEETVSAEIKSTLIGGPALPGTFADSLPAETVQAVEGDLLANLARLASATTATPAERLFAAEAHDAIRFVQALQNRYDAVPMNPPFGEPVPEITTYIKAAYPWIPVKDSNEVHRLKQRCPCWARLRIVRRRRNGQRCSSARSPSPCRLGRNCPGRCRQGGGRRHQ
jgi:hypothetical protein